MRPDAGAPEEAMQSIITFGVIAGATAHVRRVFLLFAGTWFYFGDNPIHLGEYNKKSLGRSGNTTAIMSTMLWYKW